MANLTTANSTYSAGPIDTYTPVSDATTEMLAAHINGGLSAIIAMQGDFGTGTALKRSAATLAVRLDVCLGATGGINSGTSFPVSPTPLDGQLFWRTDTKQLHLYDGALAQWQRIDSPGVHSGLSGLSADDHPQYAAIATTETISAVWTFSTDPVFNALGIPTGKLADDAGITNAKIHVSAAIAPSKINDYSASVAEMQTSTDPGEVGTESQPTSLSGELERIRFTIRELKQNLQSSPAIAQWYETTDSLTKEIPAGTVMCFFQAAAPTGWTQVTTQNDKVLRVVSGAGGGAAGSRATSSTHTHTGPSHTHTGPSHTHSQNMGGASNTLSTTKIVSSTGADGGEMRAGTASTSATIIQTGVSAAGTGATGSAGTGATGADAGLAYIDMLIASKD